MPGKCSVSKMERVIRLLSILPAEAFMPTFEGLSLEQLDDWHQELIRADEAAMFFGLRPSYRGDYTPQEIAEREKEKYSQLGSKTASLGPEKPRRRRGSTKTDPRISRERSAF